MLGGFGASGGITGSKLGGSKVTGGSACTEKLSFDLEETVPDFAFLLLEEYCDDGSHEPTLVNLGLVAFEEVIVGAVKVHRQELPAALGHGNSRCTAGQLHLLAVHLVPLLF